ncbi:unnamed protein product [Porites lobata]|uniref:OTU domain-containing protein n=1 Tax=Porites lobata TaxID=104759 RepID=A0ABN8SF34_9CNID|nr:unnamed protein product [Porites lobata]
MDEDLAALFKLVDSHIKGNSDSKDDQFKRFLCTLEKKYEKQKEFIRNLGCNAHVGLEEDEMADALIPGDLLSSAEKYKAVKTTANGDCLYNAASLTLVGNESYATLLRLLVALELVLNADFYVQHPKCTYFPAGGRHPNTVFSLCLTNSSNKVFHDTEHDKKFAILSEAWVASKPKEWSGYFHLKALATVLARPVFSSYPNCQTWIRDFLHGIIYPQMATFSVEPVFLLWSREGSDNRPGAWYEPNHSVPLYSAEASEGIDALKKEDLPKTLVRDEKKTKPVSTNAANMASPQVLSQLSKGEEKNKTSNYEESRVRKFHNASTQMSSTHIHTLMSSRQMVLSNQCSAMHVHSWQRRHLVQTYQRKVEQKSLRLKS